MDRLAILKSYFDAHSVASFQLESYNYFVTIELRHLLRGFCMDIPSGQPHLSRHVVFQSLYTSSPTYDTETEDHICLPSECRRRDMTYDTMVYASCSLITVNEANIVTECEHMHGIPLFRLPVMIGSVLCNLTKSSLKSDIECPYDKGGYFIIKGKDRVIVAQERMNYNHIYILPSKHPKYAYTAEIRSVRGLGDYSMLHEMYMPSLQFIGDRVVFPMGSTVICTFGKRHRDIPLSVFLKFYSFCMSEWQGVFHPKTEYVIQYILNEEAGDMIETPDVFFPHLGENVSVEVQAYRVLYYLLDMLDRLVRTVLQERVIDHRDHFNNKRVDACGILLKHLIGGLLKIMCKKITMYWMKHQNTSLTLSLLFQKYSIATTLHTCFTKGHWGIPKTKYIRQGVVQLLTRQSYNSTLSHLRRVIVPIGKESKNSQVRQIHASSWGFICPIETPDGASCGIVKNLTLYARIAHQTPMHNVVVYVQYYLKHVGQQDDKNGSAYVVCCNNIPIVYHLTKDVACKLVAYLRELRNQHYIFWSVSISFQEYDRRVSIYTDEGRLLRPVLTTANPSCDNFSRLFAQGEIVYIDSYEAESSVICLGEPTSNDYDYFEIHPTVMFGVGASVTPFSNHSQAPRNIYQCAMAKQAMGWNHLRPHERFDTCNHFIHYAQKRLVSTQQTSWMHLNEMASGHNVVVAIMTYTGYNQEDSVLINKSAIDRGLFVCSTMRTLSTCIQKRNGVLDKEVIQVPPDSIRQRSYNYHHLQANGTVKRGTRVFPNDVIVGKVFIPAQGNMVDCSLIVGENEGGVVDDILYTQDICGKQIIRVRIRSIRIPEIGDKVASSAAQKGTIGMVYAQEDMPFTMSGMVPDVVLNPHAIPSRMTINMLMEMLGGKKCALDGSFEDATAFTKDGKLWIESIGQFLTNSGYEATGEEIMYNGFTGEPFQSTIYMGVCYYERLKHMVSDKFHTRSRGNVQLLNRQPCAGRSRDGGLKFGEMERDCMITHGTAQFLRERLFSMSDNFQIPICQDCQSISNHRERCQCGSSDIRMYHLPYACKLLFQDLMALGIQLNMK